MTFNLILSLGDGLFCTSGTFFAFVRESRSFVHWMFLIGVNVSALQRVSTEFIFRMVTLGCIRQVLLIGALCLTFTNTSMAADEVLAPPSYEEFLTVKPRGSMDYRISGDPFIVTAQVRLALQREMNAIQLLSRSADPESLAATREVVYDGYVLLRTATHGFTEAMNRSKSQTPLLKLYQQRVIEVRHQILGCMADLERAQRGDESKIRSATERLAEVVNRIKTLLVIMWW